jgi:hypothetical protein
MLFRLLLLSVVAYLLVGIAIYLYDATHVPTGWCGLGGSPLYILWPIRLLSGQPFALCD